MVAFSFLIPREVRERIRGTALWIGYPSSEKHRLELERYEFEHKTEGGVVTFENFGAMKAHDKKERWYTAVSLVTVDGCLMTVGFFVALGLLMILTFYLIGSMQ